MCKWLCMWMWMCKWMWMCRWMWMCTWMCPWMWMCKWMWMCMCVWVGVGGDQECPEKKTGPWLLHGDSAYMSTVAHLMSFFCSFPIVSVSS